MFSSITLLNLSFLLSAANSHFIHRQQVVTRSEAPRKPTNISTFSCRNIDVTILPVQNAVEIKIEGGALYSVDLEKQTNFYSWQGDIEGLTFQAFYLRYADPRGLNVFIMGKEVFPGGQSHYRLVSSSGCEYVISQPLSLQASRASHDPRRSRTETPLAITPP